ncbi:MAG: HRDC domain-containing protein, partial [Candidatus Latescibacterota bacterium]|nr:HRDC domain-containing protein [Candidatus Latescibacterota bacterium]
QEEPGAELVPVLAQQHVRVLQRRRPVRLVAEVAREEGVPPYVVASDRTLRDIALLRPVNSDELKMAHGIGPSKAERYGDGFIQVVRQAV